MDFRPGGGLYNSKCECQEDKWTQWTDDGVCQMERSQSRIPSRASQSLESLKTRYSHTHTHTHKRTTTTKTSPECKNVINILYHLHVSMLSSNIQKPCLSKKVLLASCRYTARRCRATIWPTNFAPGHIVKEKHDLKGCMHHIVHCSTVMEAI